MTFNPENRITWEELAPSLQELFKNLQAQITREVERARNEELRLDRKIDDEIARAKAEEKRIEDKLDAEIQRSTQKDQEHDTAITNINNSITNINNSITNIKGDITTIKQDVQDNTDDIDSLEAWKGQFPWGIKSCTCSGGSTTPGGTYDDTWIHTEIDNIWNWINGQGPNKPGLIDLFANNPNDPREFFVHFTNGFIMIGVYTYYNPGDMIPVSEGGAPSLTPGALNNIVFPWMSGVDQNGTAIYFTGFSGADVYSCFTTTDEHGWGDPYGPSLDQHCIVYTRPVTGTKVSMSTVDFIYDGSGVLQMTDAPHVQKQYTFCVGFTDNALSTTAPSY